MLDRGWDLLYVRRDRSAAYNHWADDWEEVLLYFSGQAVRDAPAWVWPGEFKDAIFPPSDSE